VFRRLRDTYCFGLCSRELSCAEEPPWMHEVCTDNEITGFDRANVGPDGFDYADRLVSHDTTAIGMFHRLVCAGSGMGLVYERRRLRT
jgi:hypothetical protein